MKLATSKMICEIDKYARDVLDIPMQELMQKSGDAVVRAVKERCPTGRRVVILAGKGNNGGDGYAAACSLIADYFVTVYDVFGVGQSSEAGKHFLEKFSSLGGKIIPFSPSDEIKRDIKSADCIVDAVFGTGFHGAMPEEIRPLAITVREAVEAKKIAIDVPLGINADNGSVSDFAITVGATVELSFIKPGIISYPARSYVGEVIYDDLGLPYEKTASEFSFKYNMIDTAWVKRSLPPREANSNKGTFGKLLMITGSERYQGAAHLSLEAALRGGVGLVAFMGEESLTRPLMQKYPEAVYVGKPKTEALTDVDIDKIISESKKYSAILLGSGSDNTEGLYKLTSRFLNEEGAPLILDADAINALAENGSVSLLKNAKRRVVLTPHPLEFARMTGMDVAAVQQHRIEAAIKFASENRVVLVLKGAGTLVTDGEELFINVHGSSALAKAGSGDVLAGLLASIVAQGKTDVKTAAALAVYFHAAAGESLAAEFSSYGVTPSDLPRQIARHIAEAEKA